MMKIKTKRLILRDFKLSDAKEHSRNINNLDVVKWLLVVKYPYRISDSREYLRKQLKKQKEKPRTDYTIAIERKEERGVIGAVGLHRIDKFQGTATMGYWLGEEFHRQGYMFEAASAALDFAFRKLKLRRVNIAAYEANKASNGLIRKLGFTHEGVLRKNCRAKADGKIHDEHIYGMLREDYLRRKH